MGNCRIKGGVRVLPVAPCFVSQVCFSGLNDQGLALIRGLSGIE